MLFRTGFLVLLTALTFCGNATGQKHPQFRYISADGGLYLAGVRSQSQFDNHRKNLGAAFGLSGDYSFSDSRSVGLSLIFEQKGASDPVYDLSTNLNYFSLPVYYKWTTGKDPRFFVIAGIYSSWLAGAVNKGTIHSGGVRTRVDENITGQFNRYDYGMIFGTGILVRLYDDFDFRINIGGSAGLADITRDHEVARNFHFNINLGYVYYIGFR